MFLSLTITCGMGNWQTSTLIWQKTLPQLVLAIPLGPVLPRGQEWHWLTEKKDKKDVGEGCLCYAFHKKDSYSSDTSLTFCAVGHGHCRQLLPLLLKRF